MKNLMKKFLFQNQSKISNGAKTKDFSFLEIVWQS